MGHGRMREKEKEDAYRIMRLAASEARVMRGQKGEAECRESMHVHIVAAGIRKGEGRREDVEKVQRDVRRRDRYAGVYGSRPYDSGPSWLPPSHPLQLVPLSSSSSCFFPSFCYSLVYVPLMGPTRAPNPPRSSRGRLSRASFGESFRLCDNWLPHRVESNRVESRRVKSSRRQRRDPPAFNERHFSSFSIQPV